MTTVTAETLESIIRDHQVRDDDRYAALRRQAAEALMADGLPGPDHEQWKYTNTTAILRGEYTIAGGAEASFALPQLGEGTIDLVFVNGRFSPQQSSHDQLPEGVTLSFAGENADVTRFGALVNLTEHPYAALNTLLFPDACVLHIGPGVSVTKPINVVFASVGGTPAPMVSQRLVVVVERASSVTIVENYVGDGAYLSNNVTELIAGPGSLVDHTKFVRESKASTHLGNFFLRLERDSSVTARLFSFGGGTVRNELNAFLDGEGSECILDGLYVLKNEERVDNHTVIEHLKPHTNSLELYKGVLDGKSHGAFDGRIVVHKDAQKIASRQTNNNLLLSNHAIADSKPQLEIYADDVKCNHGSTIGQLDDDAIFYLRSRGLSQEEARSILTFAFAREIIERVKLEALREQLESELLRRIPTEERA